MSQNLIQAASINPQTLAVTQVSVANTETTAYTVPAVSSLRVATASLCNTTGAAVTVNVSVVPSGGTAAAANRVVSGYSLAAGDTLTMSDILGGALMGPGDFVSLNMSATGVSLVMTGAVGN